MPFADCRHPHFPIRDNTHSEVGDHSTPLKGKLETTTPLKGKLDCASHSTSRVGMFNHFGTVSAIVGVPVQCLCFWHFNPLPKRQTIRICDGHEDLSSC